MSTAETITTQPAAEAAPVAEATAAEAGTTESTPASAGNPTLLTGETDAGNQEAKPEAEDQTAEDKPAEGSEDKAEVPEDYTFTFEEGREIDAAVLDELKGLSKDLGLTQEQAQRVADLGAQQAQRWEQALSEAVQAQEKQWIDAVQTDKEYGGDKLAENLAVAKRALDKFGTPELKAALEESRFGNHPEMLRFVIRAGKAIADDSVVPGGRSTNGTRKPFYENSEHKE